MSIKEYIILRWKIFAARWLRITSKLSEKELDVIYQACEGEPDLRGIMDDILKQRR